ncbi:MAG: HAD-IIIA family hydrolase [Candidatus Aenigmarchaeota archaeon]|nr:HAD-IIIA family hydrolase [Candidatus Aenigmarchaeota archaeon]
MRAVFLDRDGTVTKKTSLVVKPEEIELEDGAAEGIKMLNKSGVKVIVVTNQPQVARGLISEDGVKKINDKVQKDLMKRGAHIDDFYFCPHHPEQYSDVPEHAKKYRVECSCRKPNPGMILEAAKKYNVDLTGSFTVGDRTVDILAGKNAGTRTILVKTGVAGKDKKHDIKADYECDTLLNAATLIRNLIKTKAIILAGGKGERLLPLTKDLPKPMIPINGKPVLEYHINLLKKYGVNEIVICGSYLVDKIKAYFGDGRKFRVHIDYPGEKEPLGTGGAIKNAAQYLVNAENIIVLNGDVITNMNIGSLLRFHFSHSGIATVVLRKTDHPIDSDIIKINEKNEVTKYIGRGQDIHKTANVGIMVLRTKILDRIPNGISNIEKDVLFKLLNKEKIYGYLSDAYIKDIGTPERLKKVRREFPLIS